MKVQAINNNDSNPNFGIKYVRPKWWRADVLDAFKSSELVKEIDNMYPKAKVKYVAGGTPLGTYFGVIIRCAKGIKYDIGDKFPAPLVSKIKSATLKGLDEEKIALAKAEKEFADFRKEYKSEQRKNRTGLFGWLGKLFG